MTPPKYHGKIFMYPCAGSDIAEPVQAFGAFFDTFLFVDIKYNANDPVPEIPGWRLVPGSSRRSGSPDSSISYSQIGRAKFRVIQPEWLYAQYINVTTGRKIWMVRRRGFGQYALHELPDGSLSMFMHRGDSPGEGGSNVFYLSNRRTSHKPLSRLMSVIKRKLAYPALIASDGSNTTISELMASAKGSNEIKTFESHCLLWHRHPTLDRLSGITKVWQVRPQALICMDVESA